MIWKKPTHLLDHVSLGCTPRECKPNKILINGYRNMFESFLSAGSIEKLPGSGESNAKISAGSYDMEGV